MAGKERIDRLLVEKQLAGSRERAKALILAGRVLVDDQVVDKVGAQVFADAVIRVLKDESLAQRLGQNGRQTVAEKYDWRVIYPAWETVYRGLS